METETRQNTIPSWLHAYLDSQGLQDIEDRVTGQESQTNGEIVPMVVKKSSTTGHVQIVLFFFLIAVAYIGIHPYISFQLDFAPAFVIYALEIIVLFFVSKCLAGFGFVARFFTPVGDQLAQVEMRALNEFYNVRVHHTEASTGILVFVSLLERQAVIIGDAPISEKIDQKEWEEALDVLISGLRKKSLAAGMTGAIDLVGSKLSEHFPKSEGNQNELHNHLLIRE